MTTAEMLVDWTHNEKRAFATLGVDLFNKHPNPDRRFEKTGPSCEWCGKLVDDCARGKGCGFAVES